LGLAGPDADGSEIVFHYLWLKDRYRQQPFCTKLHHSLNQFICQTLRRCDLRGVLASLCNRPYWRRTWIIQEILSARGVMVFCGQWRVCWDTLMDFCMMEDSFLRRYSHLSYQMECFQMQGDLIMSVAFRLFQQRESGPDNSPGKLIFQRAATLEKLVETFKATLCTDRRDKIYAFLGLASDCRNQERLVADYAVGLPVLFMNVMLFCRPASPRSFYPILSDSLQVTMRTLGEGSLDWTPWVCAQAHLIRSEGQIQCLHRLRERRDGKGCSVDFRVDNDTGWMRFWPFEPSLLADTDHSNTWRPTRYDEVYAVWFRSCLMLLVFRRMRAAYGRLGEASTLRMVHFGTFVRLEDPPREEVPWQLHKAWQKSERRRSLVLEDADELTPLWSSTRKPISEASDASAKARVASTHKEQGQKPSTTTQGADTGRSSIRVGGPNTISVIKDSIARS
jgi:hypothetical protein